MSSPQQPAPEHRSLSDFGTMEPEEQRAAIASATNWQNYNGVGFKGALTVQPVEDDRGDVSWRVAIEGIPLDKLIERAFGPGVALVDCDPSREESYYGDAYQAYGTFLVSFERVSIPSRVSGITPEESQRRRVAWLDAHPEQKAQEERFGRMAEALRIDATSAFAAGIRSAIDRQFEAKMKLGSTIEIPGLVNIGISSEPPTIDEELAARADYAHEQAEIQRQALEDQEEQEEGNGHA